MAKPGTNMQEALLAIKDEALVRLAQVSKKEELADVKAHFLGKKGVLRDVLSSLSKLPKEERASLGSIANEVKNDVEMAVLASEERLKAADKDKKLQTIIDTTLPGRSYGFGSSHPISKTAEAIIDVLRPLGFYLASGPEVEHDFYNFEALNMAKDHPARDMHDTFYVDNDVMLRTHTSSVQIRAMLAIKSFPLKVLSFGRVYRRDDDVTHSPMFTQIEGLCVGEGVSLSDLKGTLKAFVAGVFSPKARIRMRPSYFPFTEPSVEVDVSCFLDIDHTDCRLCKGSGFIEILGAGMVDPEVFRACNIDSERYSGFAFGMGVERIAMLRYGIPDIRLFFENDLRFLRQF
jgi:phenylalanyl-tRNA synthetase alpha chain